MSLLTVIKMIVPALSEDTSIHAMWLEGSWATGKNNEHSDIDVWLDVADGHFDQCIDSFRNELMKIGKINWEKSRGVYSDQPRLAKHTFHLAGFPEEQRIELDLQEHGRDFIFDKSLHTIKILFDKDNTIKWVSS